MRKLFIFLFALFYIINNANAYTITTSGYVITLTSAVTNPSNATTYYFDTMSYAWTTTDGFFRVYVPENGTIKDIHVTMSFDTHNSNEPISLYLVKNIGSFQQTFYVDTVSNTAITVLFKNKSMNIPINQSDYFQMQVNTPTWSKKPSAVIASGSVYVVRKESKMDTLTYLVLFIAVLKAIQMIIILWTFNKKTLMG